MEERANENNICGNTLDYTLLNLKVRCWIYLKRE